MIISNCKFIHKIKKALIYLRAFLIYFLLVNYLLANQYKIPRVIIPTNPAPPREETKPEILSTTAVPIKGTEGPKIIPKTTLNGITARAT